MLFVGVPDGLFGRSLDVETVDGSLGTLARGEIAVQRATAESNDWAVGDVLTLTGDAGPRRATIGAVIDTAALSVPLVLPESLATDLVPASRLQIDTVFVTAAPGVTARPLRADLVGVAKPCVVVSVLDQEEFASELADQVNQVLTILYALLALSTVLADSGLTTLAIPWARLAWMLILAAGAGVLAALWPAVRAARLPVLDAVSYD